MRGCTATVRSDPQPVPVALVAVAHPRIDAPTQRPAMTRQLNAPRSNGGISTSALRDVFEANGAQFNERLR